MHLPSIAHSHVPAYADVGYDNRPGTIHDRKQWEKEDAYRSGVFAVKGRKGGPPIGMAHPDTGADTPAYSFSGAERFDD